MKNLEMKNKHLEIEDGAINLCHWMFRGNYLTYYMDIKNVNGITYTDFVNKSLTSLDLKNVNEIGGWTFAGNKLTSLDMKNVTIVCHGAFCRNNLTSLDLRNVISIDDDAFRNNNLTSVDLKNVTRIGNWAFDPEVDLYKDGQLVKMIDGIATYLYTHKIIDGFKVYKTKYFNTNKDCYVAYKDEYTAHGDTLEQAIKDVKFKHLQATVNVEELANDIKQRGVITFDEFRLLTGACEGGINNHLEEIGKPNITELPLADALPIMENNYGWEDIKEYF